MLSPSAFFTVAKSSSAEGGSWEDGGVCQIGLARTTWCPLRYAEVAGSARGNLSHGSITICPEVLQLLDELIIPELFLDNQLHPIVDNYPESVLYNKYYLVKLVV